MIPSEQWKSLGWRHPVWELVRYYRALRNGSRESKNWLETIINERVIKTDKGETFEIDGGHVDCLTRYLSESARNLEQAFSLFRTEDEAKEFCLKLNTDAGTTKTQNQDHHQSSKALVAAVTKIAHSCCTEMEFGIVPNPQRRCIWCTNNGLHVTARNLDGAIPSLLNPMIIWEIKEYWGVTSGGSKMSDAVYECNLVGRELREFEERSKKNIVHIVFIDGKSQWETRRSDVVRFIDLFHQGLIDHLFIGRDVETEWSSLLMQLLTSSKKPGRRAATQAFSR